MFIESVGFGCPCKSYHLDLSIAWIKWFRVAHHLAIDILKIHALSFFCRHFKWPTYYKDTLIAYSQDRSYGNCVMYCQNKEDTRNKWNACSQNWFYYFDFTNNLYIIVKFCLNHFFLKFLSSGDAQKKYIPHRNIRSRTDSSACGSASKILHYR